MEKLKIVTFNLRCLYDVHDGTNSFIHRAAMILDKIAEEKPHVICFQEVGEEIRTFLKKYLVDYTLVGHGRLADFSGEGLGIAYRNDCMELFGLEQFWLSPSPYAPGSRYEIQSEFPRICIAAVVKHCDIKTPVRLYDVHLDHESDAARIAGIRQIIEKIKSDNEKGEYPVLVLGDFNARPESETIAFCNDNGDYPLAELTKDVGGTYHGFIIPGNTEPPEDRKIDYIFADELTAGKMTRVYKWEDKKNGIYLSDHYPVCCEFDME